MVHLNWTAAREFLKVYRKPALAFPQATVSTFNDLPIPLESAFRQEYPALRLEKGPPKIKAVVLDKDDCFAWPGHNKVAARYQDHFEKLRAAYPGPRMLIASNSAGNLPVDPDRKHASALEKAVGVDVLSHSTDKPGCHADIMTYFRSHPETGVTDPRHIAVVGDRLSIDILMANLMGSYSIWIRDGIVPQDKKSFFARLDRSLGGRFMELRDEVLKRSSSD